MHIDKNNLGGQLTTVEQAHLEQCQFCQFEHEALNVLRQSAKELELVPPPEGLWQKISEKNVVKRKSPNLAPFYFKIAASIIFSVVGYLGFGQYHISQQLEQVLMANQILELQLEYQQSLSIQQVRVLYHVSDIASQLENAKTKKEKLRLLQLRKELMNDLLLNKDSINEISI